MEDVRRIIKAQPQIKDIIHIDCSLANTICNTISRTTYFLNTSVRHSATQSRTIETTNSTNPQQRRQERGIPRLHVPFLYSTVLYDNVLDG